MSKHSRGAQAAFLLALFVLGCGNPCDDLRCDRCAAEELRVGCRNAIALEDGDVCGQFQDDAPSCT